MFTRITRIDANFPNNFVAGETFFRVSEVREMIAIALFSMASVNGETVAHFVLGIFIGFFCDRGSWEFQIGDLKFQNSVLLLRVLRCREWRVIFVRRFHR